MLQLSFNPYVYVTCHKAQPSFESRAEGGVWTRGPPPVHVLPPPSSDALGHASASGVGELSGAGARLLQLFHGRTQGRHVFGRGRVSPLRHSLRRAASSFLMAFFSSLSRCLPAVPSARPTSPSSRCASSRTARPSRRRPAAAAYVRRRHGSLYLVVEMRSPSVMVMDCWVPGVQVARRHGEDAVGVDVERDLDLRHAGRGAADALQAERADALLVVARHGALPCSTCTSTLGLVTPPAVVNTWE